MVSYLLVTSFFFLKHVRRCNLPTHITFPPSRSIVRLQSLPFHFLQAANFIEAATSMVTIEQ